MNGISWCDFEKVHLLVGSIVDVQDFPEARKPAYRLRIDLGEELGVKTSSAQITELYSKEDLVGKHVIVVANFPKKQIGPLMSEVLVTGFAREDGKIVLATPDMDCPRGARLM